MGTSFIQSAGNRDDATLCKKPTKFEYRKESGFTFGEQSRLFPGSAQLDVDGDGILDYVSTQARVGPIAPDPLLLTATKIVVDIGVSFGSGFLPLPVGVTVMLMWEGTKGMFWGLFADEPDITFH